MIGRAHRIHIARTRNSFDPGLQRARNLSELVWTTRGIATPKRQRQDRYVFDTAGLHQWLQHPKARRPPVLVRVNCVVETHDGLSARLTDFELHGDDTDART